MLNLKPLYITWFQIHLMLNKVQVTLGKALELQKPVGGFEKLAGLAFFTVH